jgi:hypothetical protein
MFLTRDFYINYGKRGEQGVPGADGNAPAFTGDVTKAAGGTVLTIAAGVITVAQLDAALRPERVVLSEYHGIGISQLSVDVDGSYDTVYIDAMLRSARAAQTSDDLLIWFNDDTNAANYYSFSQHVLHSATLSTNQNLATGAAGILCALAMPAASSPTGWVSRVRVEIYHHRFAQQIRVANLQIWQPRTTTTGSLIYSAGGGAWIDVTNPISNIKMKPLNAAFASLTQWTVLGK